ncbi:MAG: type II toxin-antitoxin system HicB family antitoxin [Candidatus Paceibacterota bacterium]|jgi:predicted RNase H-like HicB family nuclease
MLTDFIQKRLQGAKYKLLQDKTYFGEIPGVRGVWANAKTLENCRKELQETLEGWLVLSIKTDKKISGFRFPSMRSLAKNA